MKNRYVVTPLNNIVVPAINVLNPDNVVTKYIAADSRTGSTMVSITNLQ